MHCIPETNKKKNRKEKIPKVQGLESFWAGGHMDSGRVECKLRALSSYLALGISSIRLF